MMWLMRDTTSFAKLSSTLCFSKKKRKKRKNAQHFHFYIYSIDRLHFFFQVFNPHHSFYEYK